MGHLGAYEWSWTTKLEKKGFAVEGDWGSLSLTYYTTLVVCQSRGICCPVSLWRHTVGAQVLCDNYSGTGTDKTLRNANAVPWYNQTGATFSWFFLERIIFSVGVTFH